MTRFPAVLLLVCASLLAHAQTSPRFVQFIAHGLADEAECRVLEDSLRIIPGVVSVRAESRTDNVVVLFEPSVLFTEEEVMHWWYPAHVHPVCIKWGITGQDLIRRLLISECGEPGDEQRE